MEWVNVPSHRVLKVTRQEFIAEFFIVDEHGYRIDISSLPYRAKEIYRIYREKDKMMFIAPKFLPMLVGDLHRADDMHAVILEPYYG